MSYHRKIVFYYILLIIIGTLLLMCPFSYYSNKTVSLIDTLFTTVSAVCVTGLVTVDTGTTWTFFGKLIILALIQFGGIGILVILSYFNTLISSKIRLRQRLLTQEELNCFDVNTFDKKIKKFISRIILIELIGGIILATQFIPEYGLYKGIFYGIFHSISAFCNAGFDLFGNFSGLVHYKNNAIVLYTIMFLIIYGGLGFLCVENIWSFIKNRDKLIYHTKIVLITTVFLIFTGFFLFALLEWNNVGFKNLTIIEKINNLFFMSVTTRTAGFNTIDLSTLNDSSLLLHVILMFIGGAPGSTAGGIKVTTIAVVVFSIFSYLKCNDFVQFLRRKIKRSVVDASYSIFILSFFITISSLYLLTIFVPGKRFIFLLFEIFSAFGTVGLSTGITTQLTLIGKIIIIFLMFLGRLGPFTLGIFLINKKKTKVMYPEIKVMVG